MRRNLNRIGCKCVLALFVAVLIGFLGDYEAVWATHEGLEEPRYQVIEPVEGPDATDESETSDWEEDAPEEGIDQEGIEEEETDQEATVEMDSGQGLGLGLRRGGAYAAPTPQVDRQQRPGRKRGQETDERGMKGLAEEASHQQVQPKSPRMIPQAALQVPLHWIYLEAKPKPDPLTFTRGSTQDMETVAPHSGGAVLGPESLDGAGQPLTEDRRMTFTQAISPSQRTPLERDPELANQASQIVSPPQPARGTPRAQIVPAGAHLRGIVLISGALVLALTLAALVLIKRNKPPVH